MKWNYEQTKTMTNLQTLANPSTKVLPLVLFPKYIPYAYNSIMIINSLVYQRGTI